MRTPLLAAALGAVLLPAFPARAAEDVKGIAAFARQDRFVAAKISPQGTYLAAISNEGGKRTLAFIHLATRKVTSVLRPDSEQMVGSFYWANDERVVVELANQEGNLAAPVSFGELYAVDASGREGRLVFGYRAGEMQTGSHIRKGERDLAWGYLVDSLRRDPRKVLIETRSAREVGDRNVRLYKLDVYSGVKDLVAQSPIPEAGFLTDENGEPRIAVGLDAEARRRFYYRDPDKGWRELESLKGFHRASSPVGFVARDRLVYVVEPAGGGFGLFAVSIESGERKLLASNDTVPPSSFVREAATGRILAVEYEPDLPTYEFLVPSHPLCRALDGLLAAYPKGQVRILDTTADGKKAVVEVYGDRDPGQFMLLDVDRMSAEPIVARRPWIRPEEMAEMTAFHIGASDGLRIHGYVTLPRERRAGTAPPLVVLPHGGPHRVRDHWGFDPEVQLLASQGFAVLQVNYRGSGGYGQRFQEAGYRKWSDRVVQDIVDATRWAVGKGFGDPKRVCIYGASFGGYAALQGAIAAPDLFRCAAGYAGVYDLGLMGDVDDLAESRIGRAYVRQVVGEDEAALRRGSPVHNADRIKARVLLIHGGEDRRAPVKHAEALRQALAEKGNPPEWLLEPGEGHGFYDEGARERMYARLVAFLRENSAPGAPGKASASAPGSDR
jgi:dipeptidyl aminopeptidase/acylaminoacyl peptidase